MRAGFGWHLWLIVLGTLAAAGCGGGDSTGTVEVCDNSLDDDGDGATDCDDTDCAAAPECAATVESSCTDGLDDDGDGQTDCDDSDCAADPACVVPTEETDCDDGLDDDGDGQTDCDDPDCDDDPACGGTPESNCDDGLDDDGDGATDCDDSDCVDDPACIPDAEGSCTDGLDDDRDGQTDCDDPDCVDDPACIPPGETDCDDGLDDDGDGATDCMDPDCDVSADCAELCNGVDDDGDGRTDELPSDATLGDPCYEGPAGLGGIGQCEFGAVECFGGALLCVGWVAPFDEEVCDGLDNDCDGVVPPEEAAAGCSTHVTPGTLGRIELQTQVRDVDVHFGLDTTGSMSGALSNLQTNLSTTIVPGVRAMLPTAEFGVSTFDDFPYDAFGAGPDMPFILHQRVTANVPLVQTALTGIELHNGNDWPESGLESLYQIATGDGVSWASAGPTPEVCGNGLDDDRDGLLDCLDPDCLGDAACVGGGDCPPAPAPDSRAVTTGAVETGSSLDAYTISLAAGNVLVLQMYARRIGSPLDAYLSLYDRATGTRLSANDDYCGLDSRITYTAASAVDLVVVAHGYSSSVGWYALEVLVDGAPWVADPASDDCTTLEVGDNPFPGGVFDPTLAVPLVAASTRYPLAAPAACSTDCRAVLADGDSDPWSDAYCNGPAAAGVCGDGARDAATEQCDDGNLVDGDGCDATCMLEPGCGNALLETGEECDDGNLVDGDGCSPTCTTGRLGVPPFDWTVGYDPGLGHGSVGGVGFRASALPIIVHITDAPSHECTDYTAVDPTTDAHCSAETFAALNAIGAKVIAAATYVGTTELDPLGMVEATNSVVPPCAFDGSEARTAGRCAPGQCCTGSDGAGVAPDGTGGCPLVFSFNGGSGAGLDSSVVSAIDALTQYVSYRLTAVPRDDPADAVNATCFVESVGIVGFEGPTGTCPVTPTAVDEDGDTVTESLDGATPRTRVTFSIAAVNNDVHDVDGDGDVTEACAGSGSYGLFLDVTTEGGTVVATRRIVVDVP